MKIKLIHLLNIIIITVFCTSRFWGVNLPWYIGVGSKIIAIILFVIFNKLQIKIKKKVMLNMFYAITPIILIVVYSIILWIFTRNIPEPNVIRNLFTSNIYLIISICFAYVLYQNYGKRSIDLIVKCGFFSYIIGSIIPLIVNYPKEALPYLLTANSENYSLLFLTEVNDLTFALGFILLYYLFFAKNDSNRRRNLVICILMIFWGLKRIQIVALILAIFFYKFVISKISIKKASLFATNVILVICYLYVLFIHNSNLIELATRYNINFMGRLQTYLYVSNNYSSFSIFYPGIGFGYIDEILDKLVKMDFRIDYIPVISLHSDILRMYIGVGFVLFGIWIIYQCYTRTNLIAKHIDLNCAKSYLCFTIYVFVLYLTDNTYSYSITVTLYFLTILCSMEGYNDLKKRKVNNIKRLFNEAKS